MTPRLVKRFRRQLRQLDQVLAIWSHLPPPGPDGTPSDGLAARDRPPVDPPGPRRPPPEPV